MEIVDQIQSLCRVALTPLEHVAQNGVKQILTIDIDCADLPEWEIDFKGKYKTIFNTKYNLTGPAFYWFEVVSPTRIINIIANINGYMAFEDFKALPAMKKTLDHSTKVLYLGKVIWGRIVQHLGFYHVKLTQGLQLFHWCSGLDLKLKLHIYEFENDMTGLMPVIENGMAKHLNPLLGKHLK